MRRHRRREEALTNTETLKLALDALERYAPQHGNPDDMSDAITALRTAIEAAEKQEPVAWLYRDSWGTLKLSQIMPPPIGAFPVYTTPPAAQRPFVWLSEEDEQEIKDRCTTVACVLRAVKAKLKGKNT
jgi:hypothetical protein